jgi:hypothetical protein
MGVSPSALREVKIARKLLAVRCKAVFPERRFGETRKMAQGILSYFQAI